MSYQGWANYATWAVKLWIDNEEPAYCHFQALIEERMRKARDEEDTEKEARDAAELVIAEALEEFHAECMPTVTGVYSDLLQSAFDEVHWHEIAASLVGDYCDANPEEEDEDAAE